MRKHLRESNEFKNVTIEMIKKLFSKGLGEYIHIKDIGPFGGGEATLESIEGEEYGDNGYAHGYEGYEEEGYDSEDEALEAYLENNTVYVFSKDIGQSGCNWLDEDSMYNYLDDVYIDIEELKYVDSEDKKVFKELGILGSEKQSRTLVYTVKLQIDTYEDWEDDYDSFDEYVDDVASDAEDAFNDIVDLRDGVTMKVTKQSE